jgi:sterol desaturase/sphingolipid hydroxylase (fatty acid hydroxylase superfamily)
MVFVLAAATAWYAELWTVGWHESSLRRLLTAPGRSGFTDLFLFGLVVLGINTPWLLIGSLGLREIVGAALPGLAALVQPYQIRTGNLFADCALYYVLYSLLYYWNHRLWHIGRFWYLHRLHHSATGMSPILTHRNHPLSLALEQLVFLWPLAIVPLEPFAAFLIAQMSQFHENLAHADVPSSWGVVGRYVLQSPIGHRAHHSPAAEHVDVNFGPLVLWDRLFGTYCDPEPARFPVGIREPVHNQATVFHDVLIDARAFAFGH